MVLCDLHKIHRCPCVYTSPLMTASLKHRTSLFSLSLKVYALSSCFASGLTCEVLCGCNEIQIPCHLLAFLNQSARMDSSCMCLACVPQLPRSHVLQILLSSSIPQFSVSCSCLSLLTYPSASASHLRQTFQHRLAVLLSFLLWLGKSCVSVRST